MTEDREAVLDCVSPGGKPAPDVSDIDDYHDHHEHDGDKDQNLKFSKMH